MLACTTLLLSAQGLVTETTPRRGGNPNAAKRANPVPRSPASVEAGRRTYQRLCARCHGIAGKRNFPFAPPRAPCKRNPFPRTTLEGSVGGEE